MKNIYFSLLFVCLLATYGVRAQDLILVGVYDGPLTGGVPKGVELYAKNNIADLSAYGVGVANNGGGTDGQEFTFPAVAATAGQFIFVTNDAAGFNSFFGFAADYSDADIAGNGDDAIELFYNGNVIDTYGDINTAGAGTVWDYLDGWAYRKDGTGPDGTTFNTNSWNTSGVNQLEGGTTNDACTIPYPLKSFQYAVNPNNVSFFTGITDVSETVGTIGIQVVLSDQQAASVSVAVNVGAASTATQGTDYTYTNMVVTFAPGETSKTVSVAITDDAAFEPTETVVLTLANAAGIAIGNTATHTIRIADNDQPILHPKLIITGVMDGPLTGGTKAIELQATEDISNLSEYGIGSANNGQGSAGVEFAFPATSLTAGQCIYVTQDSANFRNFMGFNANFENQTANVNGDDAIELFMQNIRVDVYGDPNVDGSGSIWDYLDGWAYRLVGTQADATFNPAHWQYSGTGVWTASDLTNATSSVPFPNCTYSLQAVGIYFDKPSYNFLENEGTVMPMLVNSAAGDCNIVVHADFGNSTAGIADHTFSTESISFSTADGITQKPITFPIIDDVITEGNEYALLYLTTSSAGCVVQQTPVRINIIDNDYNQYTINEVNNENAAGVADSIGVVCILQGTLHSADFKGGPGYELYMSDGTGAIQVFSTADFNNYVAAVGDSVLVQGTIGQFLGQTQIVANNIVLLATGRQPMQPVAVTTSNFTDGSIEAHESELVYNSSECLVAVDGAQWTTGVGSFGFNVAYATTTTNDTLIVTIDKETNLYSSSAVIENSGIHGIVVQRSSSPNLDDSYRLMPRSTADFFDNACASSTHGILTTDWQLFPNPTTSRISIVADEAANITSWYISDAMGRRVYTSPTFVSGASISVSTLAQGIYQLTLVNSKGFTTTRSFVRM
jgi:hypothetical protein